jgi:hypothetical protein
MVSSLIESMLRFTAEGHENVSWNGSYSRQSALTLERWEMLPQRIADWVDGGIAVRIYYM